jgi:dTDP-4-dehydrorhamnose reductase
VFDGKAAPYDELARPHPLGYYGKTKLAAENALMSCPAKGAIVRTQVLYGAGVKVRQNFVTWVLEKLRAKEPFRVVTDQRGNPTWADDLAWALLRLVEKKLTGLYHVCGSEVTDRYTFARAIADVFGLSQDLIAPTTTAELNQPANRPMDSAFITLKFESETGFRLSGVREGLQKLSYQMSKPTEADGEDDRYTI